LDLQKRDLIRRSKATTKRGNFRTLIPTGQIGTSHGGERSADSRRTPPRRHRRRTRPHHRPKHLQHQPPPRRYGQKVAEARIYDPVERVIDAYKQAAAENTAIKQA
jgi:hypothetical protein